MKLYNTLTRQKDEFVPITPGEVKMYSCGPTVYNYFHIGNARPFIMFDLLRRYFEYRGYKVTFVQNFTDIDDKVINKANEEGVDFNEIAERYIKEYYVDAEGLGVGRATVHPRATETMDAIISIVQKLLDNGHAYLAENGDVYFRTKSFPEYGKLCHMPMEELQAGARISVGEVKEDPMDFGYAVGLEGPSGLAYRMLGDGVQVPRGNDRHPLRRSGSDLPASRKRDRPVRIGKRQALCALLGA